MKSAATRKVKRETVYARKFEPTIAIRGGKKAMGEGGNMVKSIVAKTGLLPTPAFYRRLKYVAGMIG